MGYQQQGAVVGLQRLLKLLDRGQIQMVRRFVENQHVGPARLQQRKTGAGSLPRLQVVDRAFHMIGA